MTVLRIILAFALLRIARGFTVFSIWVLPSLNGRRTTYVVIQQGVPHGE
ncbi:hypothetical protein [Brucella sp. 2280]|nr:hypothetical protein [Brucella sp. 2280]